MRHAEDDGLDQEARDRAAGDGVELLLEIPAEDRLLAEPGREREQDPERDLDRGAWQERVDALRRVAAQAALHQALGHAPDGPDGERDHHVPGDFLGAGPTFAEEIAK